MVELYPNTDSKLRGRGADLFSTSARFLPGLPGDNAPIIARKQLWKDKRNEFEEQGFRENQSLPASSWPARVPSCPILTLLCLNASAASADGHTFDLVGPRVNITVTRGGNTLPIPKWLTF